MSSALAKVATKMQTTPTPTSPTAELLAALQPLESVADILAGAVPLVIVSIRMRGHGGRWGLAHMVRRDGVPGEAGYVKTFGRIADAKRFVKGAN